MWLASFLHGHGKESLQKRSHKNFVDWSTKWVGTKEFTKVLVISVMMDDDLVKIKLEK